MFANRFTAFVDACALAGTLKRNMLCSLAEAEFFRLRWSSRVLDETENAIREMRQRKNILTATNDAARARSAMERAFEDALVTEYDQFLCVCEGRLPDPDDAHVIAAALKTQAAIIVTDNLRDFPSGLMLALGMEAKSTDAFLADTIDLDHGRAVAALAEMRSRLKQPLIGAEELLLRMEAEGLTASVDVLKSHVSLL